MGRSPHHRVLPGLPGQGPQPLQFSATGQGMHREGFVVEFSPDLETSWVGNFQPGATSLNTVIEAYEENFAFVVAGGQAYVVSVQTGLLFAQYDNDIEFLQYFPVDGKVVVGSNCDFTAYRGPNRLWRTRRISWDGIRNIEIEGTCLRGEAWSFDNSWYPFSVALDSGEAHGGSYHESEA